MPCFALWDLWRSRQKIFSLESLHWLKWYERAGIVFHITKIFFSMASSVMTIFLLLLQPLKVSMTLSLALLLCCYITMEITGITWRAGWNRLPYCVTSLLLKENMYYPFSTFSLGMSWWCQEVDNIIIYVLQAEDVITRYFSRPYVSVSA